MPEPARWMMVFIQLFETGALRTDEPLNYAGFGERQMGANFDSPV
jgi:hypothetical protein